MTIHGFYKLLKNYCLTYAGYQGKGTKARECTGSTVPIARFLPGAKICIDLKNVAMHMYGNLYTSRCYVEDIDALFYKDFTQFIQYMLDANIRPIFVDDGVYPELKSVKWERIQKQEAKRVERYEYYRQKVIQFIRHNEPDKCIWNVLLYGSFEVTKAKASRAGKTEIISMSYTTMQRELMNVMEKTRRMAYRSSFNYDKAKLRSLIEAYGIPYIVAPGEAEAFLAQMVNGGYADAAISEDSDLLGHLCKSVIRKCDYYTPLLYAQYFDIDMVVRGFGMNLDHFQDLCICLGTDYNDAVEGFTFRRTYDMVIKYGKPCNWRDITGRTTDVSIINYDKVKEIFTPQSPIRSNFSQQLASSTANQCKIKEIVGSITPTYACVSSENMLFKGVRYGNSVDVEYFYDPNTSVCTFANKLRD